MMHTEMCNVTLKQRLPHAQMGCNERSQKFQMHSAKIRPKSGRDCGPPTAARTRTGRGGCTRRTQRRPNYTAGKVHRLCERTWHHAHESRSADFLKLCAVCMRVVYLVSLSWRPSACSGSPYTWLNPWKQTSEPMLLGPADKQQVIPYALMICVRVMMRRTEQPLKKQTICFDIHKLPESLFP